MTPPRCSLHLILKNCTRRSKIKGTYQHHSHDFIRVCTKENVNKTYTPDHNNNIASRVPAETRSDLHHHHEEEVEIGHSVKLFKQRQGQEGQGGVLVAAEHIVLATGTGRKKRKEEEHQRVENTRR